MKLKREDMVIDGDTARFILKSRGEGFEVLIDTEDIDLVCGYSWYSHIIKHKKENRETVYLVHMTKQRKQISMHRLILGVVDLWEGHDCGVVDHINRNGLDNRKSNLRLISQRDNSLNRADHQGNVQLRPDKKYKWAATVSIGDNYRVSLGYFDTREEALAQAERGRVLAVSGCSRTDLIELRGLYSPYAKNKTKPAP